MGEIALEKRIEADVIGGCDIMLEMFQQGELQTLLKESATRRQPTAE